MTKSAHNVLVVEDDDAMRDLLTEELTDAGYEVEAAATGKMALQKMRHGQHELVVTDLRMPQMDGLDLLRELTSGAEPPNIIMITAFGSIDTAIKAVKLGAYDFITKPFEIEQLLLVMEKALRERKLSKRVARLQSEVESKYTFGEIIAHSEEMQTVVSVAKRVADSNVSVLLTGESGTGKELLARALHYNSNRRSGPFIAVNIGALPATLIESEMFGHERGAFTDAHAKRNGLFRDADGGTIFLDEIGELPLELQSKLLRVLQENEVRPIGASNPVDIDVRVVAATNRDLDSMRERGEFREDLYYRINVVEIEIPPLRSRTADIVPLVDHFWKTLCASAHVAMSKEVRDRLASYHWPGNVRELRNVLERCHALAKGDQVAIEDLPRSLSAPPVDSLFDSAMSDGLTMAQLEQRYILHVLEQENGNKTRAAKRLGLDRKTLYRKLDEYGT